MTFDHAGVLRDLRGEGDMFSNASVSFVNDIDFRSDIISDFKFLLL